MRASDAAGVLETHFEKAMLGNSGAAAFRGLGTTRQNSKEARLLEHSRHKFARFEEVEVLDLLARADEARRDFQLVLNGDDDTTTS